MSFGRLLVMAQKKVYAVNQRPPHDGLPESCSKVDAAFPSMWLWSPANAPPSHMSIDNALDRTAGYLQPRLAGKHAPADANITQSLRPRPRARCDCREPPSRHYLHQSTGLFPRPRRRGGNWRQGAAPRTGRQGRVPGRLSRDAVMRWKQLA